MWQRNQGIKSVCSLCVGNEKWNNAFDKKYIAEDSNDAKKYHVYRGHMELETVKEFVIANKSDALQNVILCHLSRDNAEPSECVAEVKKIAPLANVDYAAAGKEWILQHGKECPF